MTLVLVLSSLLILAIGSIGIRWEKRDWERKARREYERRYGCATPERTQDPE